MARFKSRAPNELLFSLFALIIFTIVVHAAYVTVVRPRANALLVEQRAAMLKDPNFVAERSIYVVLKDWEQEAEIILGLWALAIIGYKAWRTRNERALLARDLVHVPEGMRILPEDAREYARPLESLPPAEAACLLPRALLAALYRFGVTRNIQDVSEAARGVCGAEAERLDSELSMLRYIAWAIPAIGFIGTVRGIGDALGQAHRAVSGDVSGVTEGLGTAFNSTLVALLISIILMFLLHQLQLAQERLVLDADTYLDRYLIRHMQVR
ncbi:MAG: MotA/TolQ/ExbB proton channel family protein [Steroidobacteraceae bacterium]|nr:MotA/TolQ/ExbB proton channel family protein [Steroidobacteraceae bacterium]